MTLKRLKENKSQRNKDRQQESKKRGVTDPLFAYKGVDKLLTEIKGLLTNVSFYIRTTLHLIISATLAYYLSKGHHVNYAVMLSAIVVIQLYVLNDMIIKTAQSKVIKTTLNVVERELANVSSIIILFKIVWRALFFYILVLLFTEVFKDHLTHAIATVTIVTLIYIFIDIIGHFITIKRFKNSVKDLGDTLDKVVNKTSDKK